ncbi:hypothetical protein [Kordia sp.]|uniref:hypothetical protein n=1 Tax=Kordia sp. TaxID=1965332 RepID=UPI003B5ACDEC
MNSTTITQAISDDKITYAPADFFVSNSGANQRITINEPYKLKEGYELVAPMQVEATVSKDNKSIEIQSVLYINSSHKITYLDIYENSDSQKPEVKRIYIEFKKERTDPTTEFITYLADFKIAYDEKIEEVHVYLKSSNPRTSRGTVTTVKRPM